MSGRRSRLAVAWLLTSFGEKIMIRKTLAVATASAVLFVAGCSTAANSDEETPVTPPEETTNAPTDEASGAPVTLGDPDAEGNVSVTVDPSALTELFYLFVETNPADPYYHIHTNDSDLFVGIELYTLYGAGWTGQLGTFALDCSANGICVYLDPDGTGPLEALGPGSTGNIVIDQLEGGYNVTLTGVTFPGYVLEDLTLVG